MCRLAIAPIIVRKSLKPPRLYNGMLGTTSGHSVRPNISKALKVLRLSLLVVIFSILSGAVLAENITISGRTFFRDGVPFLPKGVDVSAFVHTSRALANNKVAQEQRNEWNARELYVISSVFKANTLRFHISQAGLDAESQEFDKSYKDLIVEAVATARRNGFFVIIVMDGQYDQDLTAKCMPTKRTERAWRAVAQEWMDDGAIMLEVFNEPCLPIFPGNKIVWAKTMQRLINVLRATGARNILLLDGLDSARSTNGLYLMIYDDLRDRVALAVHPYLAPKWFVNEGDWENHFGASAAKFPMIATEWNATASAGCVGDMTPQKASALVRYLQKLDVGLIAWGIDAVHGKLVRNHQNFELSNYRSFTACLRKAPPATDSGAGELLANFPYNR